MLIILSNSNSILYPIQLYPEDLQKTVSLALCLESAANLSLIQRWTT